MSQPVHSLFITLRRSFAGVREQHRRTLQVLGLKRREQTIEKPNEAWVRGALDKVKHLVSVETDHAYRKRMAEAVEARKLRPPLVFSHRPPQQQQQQQQ